MIIQLINVIKKNMLIIPPVVVVALFLGCALQKAADVSPPKIKRITDIIMSESSESLILTLERNQLLTYTEMRGIAPRGVLFNFPDTTLGIGTGVYSPPDNYIIISIEANEIVVDKTTTSRIFITLKKDIPYLLTPDEAGLRIAFSKTIIIIILK